MSKRVSMEVNIPAFERDVRGIPLNDGGDLPVSIYPRLSTPCKRAKQDDAYSTLEITQKSSHKFSSTM